MAPLDLNGLNVVHPVQKDSQDLTSPFPDFSAHLDLWTNLAFESDEPLAQFKRKLGGGDGDDDDDDDDDDASTPTQHTVILPPPPHNTPTLDINALLAGVGIDPLLMPTPPPQRHVHPVPSLAQLLALHTAPYTTATAIPPPAPSTPVAPSPNSPPSKRTRAQKLSSTTDNSADPHPPPEDQTLPESIPTALSAAEDKRRRNTAASARFRLKKKEREAALERRAKELEDRVVELERECEGLRRENGWLKGLVVGVTGAGATQHQQASAK